MDLMLSLLSWPPVAVAAACILRLWWARWRDYRLTARLLNGRTGSSGDDDFDDDDFDDDDFDDDDFDDDDFDDDDFDDEDDF